MIVLGYVGRKVAAIKFFKLKNGSEICLKQPAEEKIVNCQRTHLRGKIFHYFCEMNTTEEPPISIRMSTKGSCELASNSGEIPVQNRLSGVNGTIKSKKF